MPQNTLEKSVKNVLEESEKLRTKLREDGQVISQNAENILKSVYEGTVETANKVSEQIATAAKKE